MSKQEFQTIIRQAFAQAYGQGANKLVDDMIKIGASDEQIERGLNKLHRHIKKLITSIQLPQ